jgi:hypothetical protein
MKNQQEFFIKMAIAAWSLQIDRASKLFDSLTDTQLQKQVSENRNTGVYLLGHLTAIHDEMLPLLGVGEKMYPALGEVFVKNPDKSNLDKPLPHQLRMYWKEINSTLLLKLNAIDTNEWFDRHAAVTEEDFRIDPQRSKLNILLIRTSHIAYHIGQVVLLKK